VEDGVEYHYPGSNFTGPGTHVIDKVMSGVQPNSYTDSIARQHDIDYLKYNDTYLGGAYADIKAIAQTYLRPFDVEGMAMRADYQLDCF